MSSAMNISLESPALSFNPYHDNGSVSLDMASNSTYDIGNWTGGSPGTGSPSDGENEYYDALYPTIKQPIHMIIIYSVAYSVIFLLGVIGNCLVVSVVYRNKRMHSVTNYFIVNLAIADILVCFFCLPITLLSNLYTGWRFGAIMCKATPFLQGVAVSASVNTLTALSLDRYLAICHTLSFKINHRVCRVMIACIWLMAVGIMAPWAVYYQQVDHSSPRQSLYICNQHWPDYTMEKIYFLAAIFLTCYTIPLIFISVCYTMIGCRVVNRRAPGMANMSQVIQKSKVKVLKMLICVVVLFAFSWLPLYAVQVRIYFGDMLVDDSYEFTMLTQIIVPIAQWLGASNSCVNPIIYCLFSNKFRTGFKDMFNCGKRATPVYMNRNNSSGTCRNGHSYYTSIRSSVGEGKRSPRSPKAIKPAPQHRDKDEVSFV